MPLLDVVPSNVPIVNLEESELDSSDCDTASAGSLEDEEDVLIPVQPAQASRTTNAGSTSQNSNSGAPEPPIYARKWTKAHPIKHIIGDPSAGVKTRRHANSNFCLNVNFVSNSEPTKIDEALSDPSWVGAMQDKLSQFERNKV